MTQLGHQLYWVWGKSTLALYELSNDLWRQKWSGFLKEIGVQSSNYQPVQLTTPNVTYVKFSMHRPKAYVGASSKPMLDREAARRRTFRRRYLVNTEPSIRWWKQTKSYYEYVPIVIATHATTKAAYDLKTSVQQIRQPELNAPRIWRIITTKKFTLPRPPSIPLRTNAGKSLSRLNWIKRVPTKWTSSNHRHLWSIATALAQRGGASDTIIHSLMSYRTNDLV